MQLYGIVIKAMQSHLLTAKSIREQGYYVHTSTQINLQPCSKCLHRVCMHVWFELYCMWWWCVVQCFIVC